MKKYAYGFGAILFLCLLVYGCHTVANFTYSEGDRVGIVDKFSRKGTFCKTWEGELQQRSLETGGTPQTWQFSVADPEAIKQVQAAMEKSTRYKLHYEEKFFRNPLKGSTKNFVTAATPIQQ